MLDRFRDRTLRVDVVHEARRMSHSRVACVINQDIKFSPDALESYRSDAWSPLAYDVMLLAATVEFCDRSQRRGTIEWGRIFHVRLPVHDVQLWNAIEVRTELVSALRILTGDQWMFEFVPTPVQQEAPPQSRLVFPIDRNTIVPFSDGLDSRAVTAVINDERPGDTIPVRVGTKRPKRREVKDVFAYLPFTVQPRDPKHAESSGRSRGFKFAILAGLAAFLVGAKRVIVPESGQGTLGPILARVGQAYPDRRTHPQFTTKMARLFKLIFGRDIAFEHPVLWLTKGRSLARFKAIEPDTRIWETTRSCWQDARTIAVNKVVPQCGSCAACMLRRTSLHAAGYSEGTEAYLCADLTVSTYEDANVRSVSNNQREYAIAGVLHMDHLAELARPGMTSVVIDAEAELLARTTGDSTGSFKRRIHDLLDAHRNEWADFVHAQGANSFLRHWAGAV